MKKTKKKRPLALKITVAVFAAAAVVGFVSVCFALFSKQESEALFSVNPYGGKRDSIDTVVPIEEDSALRLYLPADADGGKLTVWFPDDKTVTVGGVQLISGEETSVFKGKDSFKIDVSGEKYYLEIEQSLETPALFLSTESGNINKIVKNKDYKEPGRMVVRGNGETVTDAALEHIKGRGNHWDEFGGVENASRPYNVKCAEKIPLLGMGPAKKWVLKPFGIFEDHCAYALAERMGLGFTPDLRFADVYLNNVYVGKYQVSESVQVAENRVEITDLKDLNEAANPDVSFKTLPRSGKGGDVDPGSKKWVEAANDPYDITGGYLLEMDDSVRSRNEISGFISDRAFALVLKSPEYATRAEVEYISAYWQEAEDALYSETGRNSLGKHYTEYFDLESLVKMYILQELTKNTDAGVTSCFFYKDAGGKLFAGPVWDFDAAFGLGSEYEGMDPADPGTWWANQRVRDTSDDFPLLFCVLYSHEDFRAAVSETWKNNVGGWLDDGFYAELSGFGQALSATSLGVFSSRGALIRKTLELEIRFLKERKTALDKGFSDEAAFVRYDPNGGSGHLYEPGIFTAGETVVLKDNAYSKDGAVFKGWSTVPDGEAEYQPGDKVTLDPGYIVFYAVWE